MWPPQALPVAKVYDQAGCEGCYAYAVATCLTLNLRHDLYVVAYIDILQTYTDPFYGCNGGYIAGDDVRLYMAEHGVALIEKAEDDAQCTPSCADFQSGGVRALPDATSIKRRCQGRRWTASQESMREQYYAWCCWPERPLTGPRVYADWQSTNSEEELMRHFAEGRITAAVLSLALTEDFFDYQYDDLPHHAWLSLKNSVHVGPVCFRRAYVSTSSSYPYLHAVVALGWVTLSSDALSNAPGRYWVIQNSWSHEWGEDGYCLVAANSVVPATPGGVRNAGIVGGSVDDNAMYASFPLSLTQNDGANALFAHLTHTKERYWLRVVLVSLAIIASLGLILHRYWHCIF